MLHEGSLVSVESRDSWVSDIGFVSFSGAYLPKN